VEDLVLVDLDKDEVTMLNFQETVPKIPKTLCEEFKKRSCGLTCVIWIITIIPVMM